VFTRNITYAALSHDETYGISIINLNSNVRQLASGFKFREIRYDSFKLTGRLDSRGNPPLVLLKTDALTIAFRRHVHRSERLKNVTRSRGLRRGRCFQYSLSSGRVRAYLSRVIKSFEYRR